MSARSSSDALGASNEQHPSKKSRQSGREGADPDTPHMHATHSSPIGRLYQHALDTVFGFFALCDLSRAMRVSHSWSAAVLRMPCAHFHWPSDMLFLLPSSPLSTHVSHIDRSCRLLQLANESLSILAFRMPQLIELHVDLLPSMQATVSLPHKLQSLELGLVAVTAAAVNAIIVAISKLTALDALVIRLRSFDPTIRFTPLAAVASLQQLELTAASLQQLQLHSDSALNSSHPTSAQLDQLRSLPQLRRIVLNFSSRSLAHLLRVPHSLRWQSIHIACPVDAIVSAALSSLIPLRELKTGDCTSVQFLSSLVQLHTLELRMSNKPGWPATITAEAVVDGLSSCTQLTDVTLTAPLNSSQLSVVLPCLPLLTALSLCSMSELESLSCLSVGPIVLQLRSLSIRDCCNAALRLSELRHVHVLAGLKKLELHRSFRDKMRGQAQLALTPPSTLMPTLTAFRYRKPLWIAPLSAADVSLQSSEDEEED